MKSALKVFLVALVILGLVASYVFTGNVGGSAPVSTFSGPTGEPSANGPAAQPPVNQ